MSLGHVSLLIASERGGIEGRRSTSQLVVKLRMSLTQTNRRVDV